MKTEASVGNVGDLRLADLPSERREIAVLVGEGAEWDEDQVGGFGVRAEKEASGVDAAIEKDIGVKGEEAVKGIRGSEVGNVVIGVGESLVEMENGRRDKAQVVLAEEPLGHIGHTAGAGGEEIFGHTTEAGGDGAVVVGSAGRGYGHGGTSVVGVSSEKENAIGGMLGGEPKDDATSANIMRLRRGGGNTVGG